MSLSVGERILVPGIGAILFAGMSWGFMSSVGGATTRMKTVALCASIFMTGFGYSVFWQDRLAMATGWTHTWIAVVALFALFSFWLFQKLRNRARSPTGKKARQPGLHYPRQLRLAGV
jgi:hypothetical protein